MRIAIEHRFERATLSEVEQLYLFNEPFNDAAFVRVGYQRRLRQRERKDGVFTRELCLAPLRPLPPPFGAMVPGGLFQISEHIHFDLRTHRGTWRTVPSVLAAQFEAGGELSFEVEGSAVLFKLQGEVRARIPLLGKAAERQALKTAESQHAALAAAVREQLTRLHESAA